MLNHCRNPFRPMAKTENSRLFGREECLDELDEAVEYKCNLRIMGVLGVGKSSLLSQYFNDERCNTLFADRKMIVIKLDLNDCEKTDIRKHIADRLILNAQKKGLMLNVPENLEPSIFFEYAMESLKSNGYTGILVIDDFDKFLANESITAEHHNQLAKPVKDKNLTVIVATCRDLTDDSIPLGIRGSYLYQEISTPCKVKGWDNDQVAEFCNERLSDTGIVFPDEAIERTTEFTGGIPFFAETMFMHLFDVFKGFENEEPNTQGVLAEIEEKLYREFFIRIDDWCKNLSETQWRVLYRCAELLKEKGEEEKWEYVVYQNHDYNPDNSEDEALFRLEERGLLVEHRWNNGEYKFNSLMFQKYVLRKLEEQPASETKEICDAMADSIKKQLASDASIYIDNLEIGSLSVDRSVTYGDRVGFKQETCLNLMPYEDILKALSGTIENGTCNQLVQNWQNQIAEKTKEIEDPEERLSLAADVITGGIKEEEDLKKNEETIKTLDGLYKKASAELEVDCEELLRGMSSLCKFYLKHAIVVDNALKTLDFLGSEADCSPRLVMYGKVLETSLRDNFYDFFHNHPNFKDHNTMQDPKRFCFGQKTKSDTMIGNYRNMIKQKKAALATLCNSNGIHDRPVQWWDCLLTDLKICNDERNKADHGKEKKNEPSPMPEDVDTFRKLLLNGEACEDGVLKCLKTGRELANKTVYNRRN